MPDKEEMPVEEDGIKGVAFLSILKNCLKAEAINFWEWGIGRALSQSKSQKFSGSKKNLGLVYLHAESTGKR